MTHTQIKELILSYLTDLNLVYLEVHYEPYDVLRIVIVSPDFKGMRLLKRIELVIEKLLHLSMNELSDYSMVYNPLTPGEIK